MPQNNCDPAFPTVDNLLGGQGCPKCGIEMESIEIAVEGLPLEQLRLCPGCYLVTWIDSNGHHVRQGVPLKTSLYPRSRSGPMGSQPEEC